MILNHELDVFYDTLVVCGCSKCKGLKKIPQLVTLSHYINDRILKVDGLIPSTTVKNPIGDIKKTHKNTYTCFFFNKLEVISTKFHPKLTNLSHFAESIESSIEPISILPKTLY